MTAQVPALSEDFTLFPQLPLELRQAVWRYCRPQRRVIELDTPNQVGVETYCRLMRTSFINRHAPIITRVCRESRAVAFENGSMINNDYQDKAPGWVSGTTLEYRWFIPGVDIVYLNWTLGYSRQFEDSGDSLPFLLLEASKGKAASLMADMVYLFDYHPYQG